MFCLDTIAKVFNVETKQKTLPCNLVVFKTWQELAHLKKTKALYCHLLKNLHLLQQQ